jgi:hypothetical protein
MSGTTKLYPGARSVVLTGWEKSAVLECKNSPNHEYVEIDKSSFWRMD